MNTSISLTTKLAILQQSEYEWPKLVHWLKDNNGEDPGIKPKEWTLKLKLLRILAPFLSLRYALAFLNVGTSVAIALIVAVATVKLRFLQMQGLLVIAIAGSYAKTSTKYIAWHVLTAAKRTKMTPENINTPIGIARFILSQLHISDELFIAELGEYYPGDIAGLVRFLSPDFKILTPVGFAHLERFGSKEKLQEGLEELLTTQPNKGNHFVYGKDYDEGKITQVHISRAGTEYSFQGNTFFIPLFGAHNAVNTLPALWLADQLTMSQSLVAAQLASLPFVPHRLEPTLLERNILLLDNGYNSNPESAEQALRVLREIEGSQKVITTPGFVELGADQDSENMLFGERIAAVADICVVIKSVNQDALLHGLYIGHMNADHIYTANSEEEAMNLLIGKIKPNAVILFENSVPELYKQS